MAIQNVSFKVDYVRLEGELALRDSDAGLVLFVHGSGSSRQSPRNQSVAAALRKAGVGTLLFDLLTREEEMAEKESRHLRFDIPMLANRLTEVTHWAVNHASNKDFPMGYFGSSTGAAAALIATANAEFEVNAIVSRGGRPDLAGDALRLVKAPTLLIVGQNDPEVLALNQDAYAALQCEKCLRVIPGASHLFEEPGKLESVGTMAADWFVDRLKPIPLTRR